MTHPPALAAWHHIVQSRNPQGLRALLSEEVVFHSPVVHTPQRGAPITAAYLAAAIDVFGQPGFTYVRELVQGSVAVLEFQVTIDGIVVNGVDMIEWNDADQIIDFKVMVRPLKAMELIHARMGAMLERMKRAAP